MQPHWGLLSSLDLEFELGRQDVRSGSRVLTLTRTFILSLVGLERFVYQPTGKDFVRFYYEGCYLFFKLELLRTCNEKRPGITLNLPMPQKALDLRLIKADIREELLGMYFCALFIYILTRVHGFGRIDCIFLSEVDWRVFFHSTLRTYPPERNLPNDSKPPTGIVSS